ncbi:hypothetical protein [Hymenobacter sp. CRA2]|uniref:hypothetical protein n=1 Tax=Hymenobacter sp. CRA2 TaxID=1955620 RepID=UPI00098F3446|nr:hypothetical protein [Hymenobacter sp. CRA2]OON68692.1 hypothetical protein B0919_10885 [Hymenobacter sp. CRA2]
MQSQLQAAWRELGSPDSVVTPDLDNECTSFFSLSFQRAYTPKAALELYGDTAVVTSLDVRKGGGLQAGGLRLDRTTTLAELGRAFPRAVSRQSTEQDDVLGEVQMVSLDVAPPPTDDHWRLLFKDGRLVRIDYFMPC